jgi:hypothetical protein
MKEKLKGFSFSRETTIPLLPILRLLLLPIPLLPQTFFFTSELQAGVTLACSGAL